MKSQSDQILDYLKQGNSLTPLEALERFGCFRLGARIFSLKQEGHNIISKMATMANGKKVAQYSLVAEKQGVLI